MNVPQTSCNQKPLELFLADQLDDEELAALEDHLGSCPPCRGCLNRIAAEGSWWDEARGYLSSANTRPGSGSSNANPPRATEEAWEDVPSALAALKNYLAPTDDPRMLGRLGGYKIVGVIGWGGMGIVLKGFDTPLNRYVAIKVLGPRLAPSAVARQRFAREAKAAAAVVHDNVVAIHAVVEANGLPYFVMPYLRGPSLEKRLRQTGALAVVEVLRIGMQIASGLAAAHAQGLVHRDIKPANILLEEGVERVTLTDFGLARAVDDSSLTRSGMIAGTPLYMSPEQARGDAVDHRSDLFSLGSVLYTLCTGQAPFRASTTLAVLRRVEEDEPLPVRDVNPDVPAWLETFLALLLAKDPDDRFQSAAEVAALLEGYLAHLRQPRTVPEPELEVIPADLCRKVSTVRRTPQRRGRLVLLLLAALGLGFPLLFLGPDVEKRPQGEQRTFDFRKPLAELQPMTLFGPDANNLAKTDATGLRFTLPPERQDPNQDVGMRLPMRIRGDFEIDVGFELLAVGAPIPEAGAGLEMRTLFDSPSSLTAAVTRRRKRSSPNDPPAHQFDHVFNNGETFGAARIDYTTEGKENLDVQNFRALETKGRLKLLRTGSQLQYWVRDGSSDYHRIRAKEIGSHDVQAILLVCSSGRRPVAVDVRFTDLVIEAKQLLAGAPARTELVSTVPAKSWKPPILLLLLGLFLAGGLMFGGFLMLFLQQKRERALAPVAAEESNPKVAAAPISVQCPGCGKKLKARPDLAGKKIKCPQCGKGILIPEASTAELPAPAGGERKPRQFVAVLMIGSGVITSLLLIGLRVLNLGNVPAKGQFRQAVERVQVLQADTIDATGFADLTDKDLAVLGSLPNLRHLNLDHTTITDEGMKQVGRATSLVSLSMSDVQATDAGLAELRNLINLEDLLLNGVGITDAGLVHLKACTQLRKLSLYRTGVTDAGLVHLKEMFFLEHLSLDKTQVTDAGLRHLAALSNLRYLTVWESKVTDAGVQELQKALPRLRINR